MLARRSSAGMLWTPGNLVRQLITGNSCVGRWAPRLFDYALGGRFRRFCERVEVLRTAAFASATPSCIAWWGGSTSSERWVPRRSARQPTLRRRRSAPPRDAAWRSAGEGGSSKYFGAL